MAIKASHDASCTAGPDQLERMLRGRCGKVTATASPEASVGQTRALPSQLIQTVVVARSPQSTSTA